MIKKLLLLFILSISVFGFSQPVANTPPDLESCNNIFDLTSQTPIILGSQSSNNLIVRYHHSLVDATYYTNEIVNPESYYGFEGETIYAGVQMLPGEYIATTSFQLNVGDGPVIPNLSDITVCNFYTLPVLPAGLGYFGDQAGSFILPAGTVLGATQMIYVGSLNTNCTINASFLVTIVGNPQTPTPADVTACDAYVLPALPDGCTYWSGPSGSGTQIWVGETIISTMDIYIFCANGNCSSEESFTVTINPTPDSVEFTSVPSCGPYTLPIISAAGSYSFNGVPLTGPQPYIITESGVISVQFASGFCSYTTTYVHTNLDDADIIFEPLHTCDDNLDGFTQFNLTDAVSSIQLGADVELTFHETQQDAEGGFGAVNSSMYSNISPNSQTLYVRISTDDADCFAVSTLVLVADPCMNNYVSGTVRVDFNANGCTATDTPHTNALISCTNGNDVMYAYTNDDGQYSFENVQPGNNIFTAHVLPLNASPSSHNIAVTGTGNTYTGDFCIATPPAINDASILIIPISAARPGFDAYYNVMVINNGTTLLNGSVILNFNNAMLNYLNSTPTASSVGTTSLTFNLTNLLPYQTQTYYVVFNVETPPTVNDGDLLFFTANVSTSTTDVDLTNNTNELMQAVVNSYDPNDITVHEGPYISAAQTGNYLHYTVRFQNTGTADAINIRLENELDPKLDWATFEPLASSHTYQAQRSGNEVIFRFDNIGLPASSINEPESHGFMTYKIKPVANFDSDDIISNTADIFFDYNAPITTNIVTTQMIMLSNPDQKLASLQVYPNPASDVVYVRSATFDRVAYSILDIQGKVILSGENDLQDNVMSIDISGVESGLYFLKTTSGANVATTKLIIK
ncbi:MAG TPA: T9SS type A sorting domain-containing protein [Flavobacterium sp.]|jgi:uncharacterized repeat protein (TIGR01451 family)